MAAEMTDRGVVGDTGTVTETGDGDILLLEIFPKLVLPKQIAVGVEGDTGVIDRTLQSCTWTPGWGDEGTDRGESLSPFVFPFVPFPDFADADILAETTTLLRKAPAPVDARRRPFALLSVVEAGATTDTCDVTDETGIVAIEYPLSPCPKPPP